MRISKNVGYESPYNVTGIIKLTGSKEKPNYRYLMDRNNGTW